MALAYRLTNVFGSGHVFAGGRQRRHLRRVDGRPYTRVRQRERPAPLEQQGDPRADPNVACGGVRARLSNGRRRPPSRLHPPRCAPRWRAAPLTEPPGVSLSTIRSMNDSCGSKASSNQAGHGTPRSGRRIHPDWRMWRREVAGRSAPMSEVAAHPSAVVRQARARRPDRWAERGARGGEGRLRDRAPGALVPRLSCRPGVSDRWPRSGPGPPAGR